MEYYTKESGKNLGWLRDLLHRGRAALSLVRCYIYRLPPGRSHGLWKFFLQHEGSAHDFIHLPHLRLCARSVYPAVYQHWEKQEEHRKDKHDTQSQS